MVALLFPWTQKHVVQDELTAIPDVTVKSHSDCNNYMFLVHKDDK